MRALFLLLAVGAAIQVRLTSAALRVDARRRLAENPHISRRYRRSDSHAERHRTTRDVFGLGNGERMHATDIEETAVGTTQVKLKETFKGKNVFDASVTLTIDAQRGTILDASGTFTQNIEEDLPDPEPLLSDDELFEILVREAEDEDNREDIGGQRIRHDIFTGDRNTAVPVAVVEYLIETETIQKRPTAMINSRTGEIIKYFDNLEPCFEDFDIELIGGNEKIGKIDYSTPERCLDIRNENGICYLENEYVKVVNMNSTSTESRIEAVSFHCNESYHDGVNGAYSPALDALYYGTEIGKMFRQWYNMDPIIGGVVLRVHFSRKVMNAFWNGQNVSFGDGRKRFVYPLVCMDITAHELAHGLTEQHSGLLYIGQSGGLNEAFSDMTGVVAELFINRTDWQVGEDIMWRTPMRYMDDPEKDGRSIAHVSKYTDRLYPHATSGVYNKVFYLLGHDYGLDPVEVYRVFLHANKMYWHPLTDFKEGACDVMQAAYDMGQPGEPFSRAFAEVGIEVCDIDEHLVHLRHNSSLHSVTVSNTVKPMFGISLPDWSKELMVKVSSNTSEDITIHVFNERWVQINDTTVPLAVGDNDITVDVSERENHLYVIRLSVFEETTLRNVSIWAGYTCIHGYSTTNFMYRRYYSMKCLHLGQ